MPYDTKEALIGVSSLAITSRKIMTTLLCLDLHILDIGIRRRCYIAWNNSPGDG
jgi:hypothetical protein